MKPIVHKSAEDYLECILVLQEQGQQVRSIDIVKHLGFTKPSVSIAMKKLKEKAYIEVDSENLITLTPAGMEIAQKVYDRHRTIAHLLEHLGVGAETAASDACKIEHELSEETMTCIQSFVHFLLVK